MLGPFGFFMPPSGAHASPIDADSLSAEPLIDEPVTSGGDSTTWADRENNDENNDRPSDKKDAPGTPK